MKKDNYFNDNFAVAYNKIGNWYETENVNPYVVLNLVRRHCDQNGLITKNELLARLRMLGLDITDGMFMDTIFDLQDNCAGIEVDGDYIYYDEEDDFAA